jgi:ribosomal protein S5
MYLSPQESLFNSQLESGSLLSANLWWCAPVVVGDGYGLVGYGGAEHDDSTRAMIRALAMAVRSGNMNYVDRLEGWVIWTEMSSKLAATCIILRQRPVGLGITEAPSYTRSPRPCSSGT